MAAAAVVVVVLAVVLAVRLLSGDEAGGPSPAAGSDSPAATGAPSTDPSSATAGSTPPPPGWRTESFHGASVSVPPSWAVGGSPIADGGSAGLVDCGVGAGTGQSYVGRPVPLVERCTPLDPASLPAPTTAYVWFGSPQPPGAVSWETGYVSETVEVDGQRITVTSADADEREQIVASARPTGPTDDNGCPAVQPDLVAPAGAPDGDLTSLSVCVYERTAQAWEIRWSGERDAAVARALVEAVETREPEGAECEGDEGTVRLQIYAHTGAGPAAYVVDRTCGMLRVPGGTLPLDDALTSPWAWPAVDLYAPPSA